MLEIEKLPPVSPFILAPLAGYTDLPFRLLCREYGAGFCVSEMISCHGLAYNQKKTLAMMASCPEDRPVSFQLFGADPEIMAKAAAIMKTYQPDMIDINMGCPVRKVTKKGAGAALMKDTLLASKIIKTVKQESGLPVTVKFRAGPNCDNINAVSFAKMAEDTGASAVTVHGRTWAQGFSGKADWKIIAEVKDQVHIPVIGNGDVRSYQDGLAMMVQTGCDGVMIGRGAMGNPWAFQEKGQPHELANILQAVFRHLQLMEQHLPTDRLLGYIKNHIGRYFKGFPGSSNIRKTVYDCASFTELKTSMQNLDKV